MILSSEAHVSGQYNERELLLKGSGQGARVPSHGLTESNGVEGTWKGMIFYILDSSRPPCYFTAFIAHLKPVDSFRIVGSLSTRVKIRTVGVSFCQPAPRMTFFVPLSGPLGFFAGLFS
jgi:hypothetical protein